MKKWIAFMLAAVMLLSLFGCAKEPAETEPTESGTPTETTVPPETERDPQLGTYADNVYVNEFLGIQCQVDDSWYVYSDAEMAQLNGLVLDTMTDEDLVAQLEKASVVHLFYAAADEGLTTMNIALENLGLVNGVLLDEQAYIEASIGQLPAALESMGLTDVTAVAQTITLAGQEHAGAVVHGTYSGVDFYEALVCLKVGNYVAVVTVASYYEDRTETLLANFKAA